MARKRKYLDDIGYNDRPDTWNKDDKRQKIWRKQRKKYGFDNREVWNMDLAFYLWLYERLMRYKEITPVDLKFHKFDFEGKTYTQGELIDEMVKRLRFYLSDKYNQYNDEHFEYVNKVQYMWAEILHSMWY